MSLDIAYSSPVRKDICIAYCYYNPSGNPVVLKNAKDLENKLIAANIPYFNAELVFPGAAPALENPTLSLSCNSPLFYKESVWNLLEKKMRKVYSKSEKKVKSSKYRVKAKNVAKKLAKHFKTRAKGFAKHAKKRLVRRMKK